MPRPSTVSIRQPSSLHGEHQAGAHAVAVDQHRAGAAHAVLAADMRAGEPERVAQEIGEQQARLDRSLVGRAVDRHLDRARLAHALASVRASPRRGRAPGRRARRRDDADSPTRHADRCSARRRHARHSVAASISAGSSARPSNSASASAARFGRVADAPSWRCGPARSLPSATVSVAATAASAKSPPRRATSSKPQPVPGGSFGNAISVTSSSAARSTVSAPRKKSRAGDRAPPRSRRDVELGVEQQRHHRQLGGGIGMRQAAADGAAVADREMRDVRHGVAEHRQVRGDHRRGLDPMMPGERADA